jgi:hypothetical protein
MSTFFKFKGTLSFLTEEDAAQAYTELRNTEPEKSLFWMPPDRKHGTDLVLNGKTLIFDNENFSGGESYYSTVSLINDITAKAVSGRVQCQDGDGGLGTTVSYCMPPKKFIGPPIKKGEYNDPFSIKGKFLFATPEDATHFCTELLAAFKEESMTGLKTKKATVSFNISGRTADTNFYAARKIIFDYLLTITEGHARLKHMGIVTTVNAPQPIFGSKTGTLSYVNLSGGLKFRNENTRAEAAPLLEGLPIVGTDVGKAGLKIEGECKLTKDSLDSLIDDLKKLIGKAARGEISLQSNWGFQNLKPD